MKITRRALITQGTVATIAIAGAGPHWWATSGHALAADEHNDQIGTAAKGDATGQAAIDETINQVPYISNYYLEPKVDAGQDFVVNYYVTDFMQKEYLRDDHSQTFTVEYWVNGVKNSLPLVIAGDNHFTVKGRPAGKVLFALQATDSTGRKSHRIFQEFWVVNAADAVIPANKVLSPDLKKFGIYNDDTHPVETTKGLTDMLKWSSENGFRKVVLPKGRYRIDENSTVQMATNLSLDMNGATFKLNPNALDKCMMMEMYRCLDSHVFNGTFEGDLNEHDYKKAPNNSEWLCAVNMGQDTQYCSFENIKVVDITGYGTNTNFGGAGTRTYTAAGPVDVGKFALGDLDNLGNPIASATRALSVKAVDIKAFLEPHGFIQMGHYLGYQGNPAGKWIYKAAFYDEAGKFIEAIEGYMYRRLYVPKNARTVRMVLLATALPAGLSLFSFRPPYNCAYKNVEHLNVRCVGMVPSGFNNLLVEGCTFENCGTSSAKCAFDAEDGWDMMQDLTFRNNIFGKNPHNEFLLACADNFVMEGNTMSTYVWDRSRGVVFRNNTLKSAGFRFGTRNRSGYPRITGNTIAGGTGLTIATSNPDYAFCIKDNICNGGISCNADAKGAVPGAAFFAYFYHCKINGGSLNAKVVHCEIKDIKNVGGTYEIYNSTIDNCFLKTSGYKEHSKIVGSTVTNSHLHTQGGSLLVENNTLTETDCAATQDWSDGHEWILNNNKITTSMDHLLDIGNSFKQVVLSGNTITSTNPAFTALLLRNPTNAALKTLGVTLTNGTYNAKGGTVLCSSALPAPGCILTLTIFGNTYNGITEMSKNLENAPNVNIVRTKPMD